MFDKLADFFKNPKHRQRRIFLISCFSTVFVLLIMVGIGFAIWNNTVVPPPPPPMEFRPILPSVSASEGSTQEDDDDADDHEPAYIWPAPERMTDDDRRDMFWTFLIVGLNEGTNANTVMVASYCGVSREANLVSIPRDVPVHATRRGRKLSSSYLVGAGGGRGRAGGIAQVQRDVMNVIGFIPDFYIVIDYDAFFSIIDAVGGIEIDVPMRMRYDDRWQNLHIDIHPGVQRMDSETALHFVRFRRSNRGYPSITDFQRIENQQMVIDAVIRELLRPQSLLRIPEFVNIFNESVYTDLTMGNMMWFALELNNIRGTDAMHTHTLLPYRSGGSPNYYEFLSATNVIDIINNTVNPFYIDLEVRDLNIIRQ